MLHPRGDGGGVQSARRRDEWKEKGQFQRKGQFLQTTDTPRNGMPVEKHKRRSAERNTTEGDVHGLLGRHKLRWRCMLAIPLQVARTWFSLRQRRSSLRKMPSQGVREGQKRSTIVSRDRCRCSGLACTTITMPLAIKRPVCRGRSQALARLRLTTTNPTPERLTCSCRWHCCRARKRRKVLSLPI